MKYSIRPGHEENRAPSAQNMKGAERSTGRMNVWSFVASVACFKFF